MSSNMNSEKDGGALPAPRLQFRWVPCEKPGFDWTCVYELVLPLREYDIRREREDGDVAELALEIAKTNVGTLNKCPNDSPYRDGAHARWDNEALGGHLPIIVIDPLGRPFVERERADGGMCMVPFVAISSTDRDWETC